MKRQTHILLMFILLFCISAEAQIKLNYAMKAGLNFTTIPHKITTLSTPKNINKYSLPAPLLGGSIDIYLRKHLFFSVGAEYKKMNNYFHQEYIYSYSFLTITSNVYENEFYNKICFPIAVGFQFGKKIHSNLYAGYELNYFINGQIEIFGHQEIDSSGIISNQDFLHNYINPFSKNIYYESSKLKGQIIFGFSVPFSKHFKIGSTIHLGKLIKKYPIDPYDNYDYNKNARTEDDMYKNSDFDFTIKYYFKPFYSSVLKPSE